MLIGNTKYCTRDVIVLLPSDLVTEMIKHGAHILPRPGLFFLEIPSHIRRVWVYEEDVEGITIMITLNRYTLPNGLYYITNPLYSEIMETHYHFPRDHIPSFAPRKIRHRFLDHLHHVW